MINWWKKKHTVFGKEITVNWKMVLIVAAVIIAMFVFLPGGCDEII